MRRPSRHFAGCHRYCRRRRGHAMADDIEAISRYSLPLIHATPILFRPLGAIFICHERYAGATRRCRHRHAALPFFRQPRHLRHERHFMPDCRCYAITPDAGCHAATALPARVFHFHLQRRRYAMMPLRCFAADSLPLTASAATPLPMAAVIYCCCWPDGQLPHACRYYCRVSWPL